MVSGTSIGKINMNDLKESSENVNVCADTQTITSDIDAKQSIINKFNSKHSDFFNNLFSPLE